MTFLDKLLSFSVSPNARNFNDIAEWRTGKFFQGANRAPSNVNIDLFPDCTVRYSTVPLEAPISFAFRISAWSRRNFESAKFLTKGKREEEERERE